MDLCAAGDTRDRHHVCVSRGNILATRTCHTQFMQRVTSWLLRTLTLLRSSWARVATYRTPRERAGGSQPDLKRYYRFDYVSNTFEWTPDGPPRPSTTPLRLEVGRSLIVPLFVNPAVSLERQSRWFFDEIQALRERLGREPGAREMGLSMPGIHITDNFTLPKDAFAVYAFDAELLRLTLPRDRVLVLGPAHVLEMLGGEPAAWVRPAARWLPTNRRQEARDAGCTVLDRAEAVLRCVEQVVRAQIDSRLVSWVIAQAEQATRERTR